MKKLSLFVLFILSVFAVNKISAQACGTPSDSIPNGSAGSSGFANNNTLPCAIQDSAYNNVIQFTMYSTFDYQGIIASVDSVQFVTINNLPCGICWSTNKASNTFKASEAGVMNFSGTTVDSAGQYKLSLTLNAWTGGSEIPVDTTMVNNAGINLFFRVRKADAACTSVDTSQTSATSLGAHQCTSGINEVLNSVNGMSIIPNPMNASSLLTFSSDISTSYLLRITNIEGQEISAREITAVSGLNKLTIERGKMAAGMYLVTLSNGRESLTRKLAVID